MTGIAGGGAAIVAINGKADNPGVANQRAIYSDGAVQLRNIGATTTATSLVGIDATGNLSTTAIPAAVTASNGLIKIGNDVQLGGTLLANTNINTTGTNGIKNLDVNGGGNFTYSGTGNAGFGTTTPINRVDVVANNIGGSGDNLGQAFSVQANTTGGTTAQVNTAVNASLNQTAGDVTDIRSVLGTTTIAAGSIMPTATNPFANASGGGFQGYT